MNMNEFQRLATASTQRMGVKEKVEKGLMFLDDHVEEAAALYVKVDKERGEEQVMAVDKLADMLGFMLVDIALICEGLMMNMGSVATRNLMNVMKQRGETDLEEESAKGVLRKVYEMVGKVVQTGE